VEVQRRLPGGQQFDTLGALEVGVEHEPALIDRLAGRLGRQFEGKFFKTGATIDASALELPDFSATTDLYQVASNVYEVRLVPISIASLGIVVAMAILPFLAIALMFIPSDVIVEEIAKLLL
jgi:hypothetical protein